MTSYIKFNKVSYKWEKKNCNLIKKLVNDALGEIVMS